MSKELEALRELGMQTVHDEEGYEEPVEVYLKEHYYKLMKLLLPPTEEEVCEVLSDYYSRDKIIYENGNFYVEGDDWKGIYIELTKDEKGNYVIYFWVDKFPPHIVIMVGRFYESKVKDNE